MTTNTYRVIIFGCLFSLLTMSVMVSAFDRPIVSERVTAAFAQGEDSVKVWVYLQDKNPLVDGRQRPALAESLIGERSLSRRRIKGLPTVTEYDRPIADNVLAALSAAGLRVKLTSRWLGAVSGWANQSAINKVAMLPWVDSVRVVRIYRRRAELDDGAALPRITGPHDDGLDYGLSLGQLAQIKITNAHSAGYDGDGVMIGFLDTGFNPDISAFASTNIVATWDFINDDEDIADDDPVQMDHGTKTLSCCAAFAEGEVIGGAYAADYVLAKTELMNDDDIEIEEDWWVAGLEWCERQGADIVSSSLGYPSFYVYADLDGNTAITTKAADIAAAQGVLVVTAAGNEGDSEIRPWIIPPGDADSALTVGAVYNSGTKVGFSSIGPTADGRIKPDVMAQGSQVWVADDSDGNYQTASGTSFSTPLVAGACALMLQKNPGLRPYEIIERLRQTASRADTPDNEYGYGIVNLDAAMNLSGGPIAPDGEILYGPNPFSTRIKFKFSDEERNGPFDYWIYNSAGELVFNDEVSSGWFYWDGVNNAGERVANGIYICQFRSPRHEYQIKVALISQD